LTTVVYASLVRDVHEGWAWVVVIGNGLAGLWALAAHRVVALRRRALWVFTAVVEVAVVVQAVLGVILLSETDEDPPSLHLLYGFSGIIAVGIIYSYRSQLARSVYLLYGLGGLFIMGLGIRAMLIG
jgi:hypothetical protein